MNAPVDALADVLLEAKDAARLVSAPLEVGSELSLDAGYEVARILHDRLTARGFWSVGRKIGLTNRAMWEQFRATQPIWAHMYAQTVHVAKAGVAHLSLGGMFAPRLETEVVLKLRSSVPAGNPSVEELVACVEWVAVGFEVVDSHYPEWRFTPAEAVADFGVHAALVVGEPWEISSESPTEVAAVLESLGVTLRQGDTVFTEGHGRNALGSPLLALGFLSRVVASQPWAPPLAAGEIVTTGTLTPLPYLHRGERWQVTVAGASLPALELRIGD